MPDEQSHIRARRMRGLSVAVAERLARRLPSDLARTLHQFVDVGEYGLFTETLCAALAKRGIAVTSAELAQLAALAAEVEGESYQPSRFLPDITVADAPVKVFARLPENFYEMSEEEQLARTRQVGQDMAATFERDRRDRESGAG